MSNINTEKTLVFDLSLLEIALQKAIELCNAESEMLSSKLNVKLNELERISDEKIDVMNFIDWHIPIIVRYINMHKDEIDSASEIIPLATRCKIVNDIAINEMKTKYQPVIGNDKVSTITILNCEDEPKSLLELVFLNDSEKMPSKISSLLKEMIQALENNFHKISFRKTLNDQILNLASEVIASEKKTTYNPKKSHIKPSDTLIFTEDC